MVSEAAGYFGKDVYVPPHDKAAALKSPFWGEGEEVELEVSTEEGKGASEENKRGWQSATGPSREFAAAGGAGCQHNVPKEQYMFLAVPEQHLPQCFAQGGLGISGDCDKQRPFLGLAVAFPPRARP